MLVDILANLVKPAMWLPSLSPGLPSLKMDADDGAGHKILVRAEADPSGRDRSEPIR